MFSCCAASNFIKFTARETAWLVIFPKGSPEERQSLSGINASCKLRSHGCPGDPFPNTTQTNHCSMHTFIQISKGLLYMWHPHSHTHLWTLTLTTVHRLNNQMQSQWGRLMYLLKSDKHHSSTFGHWEIPQTLLSSNYLSPTEEGAWF